MMNQIRRPLSERALDILRELAKRPHLETRDISPSMVMKFVSEGLAEKFFAPCSNSVTGYCQAIRITPAGRAALT
jgi:hypothetical protein